MRVASIDIGTNTVLLLVADAESVRQIRTLHEEQRIIRIGKNVDAQRNILPEGFEKCAGVLSEYARIAHDFACEKIVACGTSALRDAKNRGEFVSAMRKQTGVNIEVISGNEEALWTYRGGIGVLEERNTQELLLIDIGGGSTEFIQGDFASIRNKASLDIGSVRLTEKFIKHDPIRSAEESGLREKITQQFRTHLAEYKFQGLPLFVGVAGTCTTLAAMILKLTRYEPDQINGFIINLDELKKLVEMLHAKTLAEKKSIVGLEPERADVIYAGSVILLEAMRFFDLSELIVSNYGLRYGLVMREFESSD